jgi:predicted GNAT family acetyltransferase
MIAGMQPLDNPVWHALTGPHASLAEGGPVAKRYNADFTPFAALPDDVGDEAWQALGVLAGPNGVAALARDAVDLPPGWSALMTLPVVQMVAAEVGTSPTNRVAFRTIDLGADDVDDMLALVAATEPGPFARRTVELGPYLGVRDAGELVAMAGCRMRLDGFREISAVCTSPSHRGRGLAEALVRDLTERIRDGGDTPILHALTTNENAIRLYVRLGFVVRTESVVHVVRVP